MPRGARGLPLDCLRLLERADLVVHAGDFVAESVLEELRGLGPLEGVHGNNDEPTLREVLPAEHVVEAGGARIGIVHDAGRRQGREERLVARFPSCDAVVYGHTHVPQIAEHKGVLVLNPGSPTERRRAPTHTMIELEIGSAGLVPRLVELRA
jgi:putative phosphoesterase